jgi:signal recognition particle receptor subunit beta
MVQINFANKEIQCKIVYYGPGMSGKTTNLEVVHKKAPVNAKGDLTSIATEGDRTLFFDFMPLDLGNIAGIKTKFQLYTVPGQVYYNSTRKLVLQGVDGIVFVADSQAEKVDENIEAIDNLKGNLKEYGRDLDSIPVVFQWNKRDLPTALTVEELEKKLNPLGAPSFEAVASTGEGVFPTLKALASLVLESINRDKKDGASAAMPQPTAAGAARPRVPRPGAAAAKPSRAPARPPAPRAPAAQPKRAPAQPKRAPAPPKRAPAQPRRPAARRAQAPAAVAPARPAKRAPKAPRAEPVRRPVNKPVGRVQIRERTDTGRLLLMIVVAAVIIGAIGFLIMRYL